MNGRGRGWRAGVTGYGSVPGTQERQEVGGIRGSRAAGDGYRGFRRRIASACPGHLVVGRGPCHGNLCFVFLAAGGARQTRLAFICSDNLCAFNATVRAVTRTISLCTGRQCAAPIGVTARSPARSGRVAAQHPPAVASALGPLAERPAARPLSDNQYA